MLDLIYNLFTCNYSQVSTHSTQVYFIHASNHTDLMLKILFADLEAVASQVVNIPNQNELLDDAPGTC